MLLGQVSPVVVEFFLDASLLLQSFLELPLEDALVETDQQFVADEGRQEVVELRASRAERQGVGEGVRYLLAVEGLKDGLAVGV